jgi:hypothetical protein
VDTAIAATDLLSSSPHHRVPLLELLLTLSSICPVGTRSRRHLHHKRKATQRELPHRPLHERSEPTPTIQHATATDSQPRLVYVTLGELRLLPLDLPRVWSRSRMTQRGRRLPVVDLLLIGRQG